MTYTLLVLLFVLFTGQEAVGQTLGPSHSNNEDAHHSKLHASAHSEDGEDEIKAENLGTNCTSGQILESDGTGGLVCATDDGTSFDADFVTLSADPNLTNEKLLGTDVFIKDTSGNRPAANTAGVMFYASDTGAFERDNGASYDTIVPATWGAARGGTGNASYTAGDVLYASGTTTLSKLGIGASAAILTSSGTAPQWSTGISAAKITSGTLAVARGGTGLSTITLGSILYASSANTIAGLGLGVQGTVLASTGTAPSWSNAVNLSAASGALLRVTDTTNTVQTQITSEDTSGYVGTISNHQFHIRTNNTVQMIFDGSRVAVGNVLDTDTKFNVVGSAVGRMVRFENGDPGVYGAGLELFHDSATPADNDEAGRIEVKANDSGGTPRYIGWLSVVFTDVTSTTMDSEWRFRTMDNVNANNANTTATLSSLGVWTDASAAANKRYEGPYLKYWPEGVLPKLKGLTLERYHSSRLPEGAEVHERHFGPTAEEFYETFGLGTDPEDSSPGIAPKDMASIALAAIVELEARVAALEQR